MRFFPSCLLGVISVATAALVPGKAFDRFITIWLENQDFDNVAADPAIADLKRQGILLNRYYAQTHPSQPNYLASVAGDYWGLDHDGFVRVQKNVSTVVDLLDWKHISWRGYFEDQPGPGYMGMGSDGLSRSGQWDYVRKHNPFVSYDSINMNGSRLLNLQSFEDFKRDFTARTVPQFVFMSPNMKNDGHNTTLNYASSWAQTFLKPLLDDRAFAERTLILLTYDESATYGRPNRIASLLLGSAVPAGLKGSSDNTFYTHYSILSTVEYNWGLPNLGRYDVGANVFQFAADLGGYTGNKEPQNAGSVDNSRSYPGYLSRDASVRLPVPPPNQKLVGAGGLGILNDVREDWLSLAQQLTPYDGSGDVYDGDKNLPVYKAPAPNVI